MCRAFGRARLRTTKPSAEKEYIDVLYANGCRIDYYLCMSVSDDNPWHLGLTPKQRRFCECYSANGGNCTRAAAEAGYKKPHPEGSRLLRKATIATALEKLRSESTSSAIATREERQKFWSDFIRDESIDPQHRLKASELLGKSQADFIDRKEITGANGSPLEILLSQISGASIAPRGDDD